MRHHSLIATTLCLVLSACAQGNSKQDDPPDTENCKPSGDATVSDAPRPWEPVLLTLQGPSAAETDTDPNPFLDFRMTVLLTGPSNQTMRIPGVFAGDGNGGSSGSKWQAHVALDEPGAWDYEVEFLQGDDAAIADDTTSGQAVEPDGQSGRFCVQESASTATGFYATGKLEYVGEHYLRTASDKPWIKSGTNSPENFLGYAGFDNTINQPGGAEDGGLENGLHLFPSHEADWAEGDPDWHDGKGKAIIGAVNYLAEIGVNSIYMMLCNLEGDGREVYPYVSPEDLLHFDLSKLEQWNTVFTHAQSKGVALHFVFNEIENQTLHDAGELGTTRKLYYREMVARFAHHPAVLWNIGEESTFGAEKLKQFAKYVRELDAYQHPTAVHTLHDGADAQYLPLVGSAHFTSTSLQITPAATDDQVELWRTRSTDAEQPWVINVDEPKEAGQGIIGGGGLTDQNFDEYRKLVLWPAYLSGAGGVEWYFSGLPLPVGDDIRAEDFRVREDMYRYSTIAREFLLEYLPFTEMQPNDALLSTEDDSPGQVFLKADDVYTVYLPKAESIRVLDLSAATGSFEQRWFNPRTGEFEGDTRTVQGGAPLDLGAAPSEPSNDWVILIVRKSQ
jgi:hypothetical protein